MKTLIVIDMQNDFVYGKLGSENARSIIPNIAEKIIEYDKNGDMVIFTRDTHFEDYLNTQEGNKLPIKHCIRNTDGWNIVDNIDSLVNDNQKTYIDKLSFGYDNWCSYYGQLKDSDIELTGVCTDICVVSNALILKSLFPENKIVVNSDCCAGTSIKNHENALSVMNSCQIDIIGGI